MEINTFKARFANFNMNKNIIFTALNATEIAAVTLSNLGCAAQPNITDQNTNSNTNATEQATTPEGNGPYIQIYKNGIDKTLAKNLAGADNLNGFSIEISGTANGPITENFAGYNNPDGSRSMVRRAFNGTEYKDELLGLEDFKDENGEWTRIFDSTGDSVLLIPKDHAKQFESRGRIDFDFYPSDYTAQMMPTYEEGTGLNITIQTKSQYDSSIFNTNFVEDVDPSLPVGESNLSPEYKAMSSLTASGEFLGIPVTATLILDKSLATRAKFKELVPNTSYPAKEFNAAFSEYTATMYYELAIATGGADGKGLLNEDGTKPTIEQYMEMVLEVKNGTRPATDIKFTSKYVNNISTEGYVHETQTFIPFWEEGEGNMITEKIPKGIVPLTDFKIVYYDGTIGKLENTEPKEIGTYGLNFFKNELIFYKAVLTTDAVGLTELDLIAPLHDMSYKIITGKPKTSANLGTLNIISNATISSEAKFKSVIKIIK